MRKAVPVNAERLESLRRLREAAGPEAIAVEDLLEAFLSGVSCGGQKPEWAKLMGRFTPRA